MFIMEYVEIDYYIKNVKLQVLTQYTKPKEPKERKAKDSHYGRINQPMAQDRSLNILQS